MRREHLSRREFGGRLGDDETDQAVTLHVGGNRGTGTSTGTSTCAWPFVHAHDDVAVRRKDRTSGV